MTELEKIAYAKSFIDKLANGINPIDDSTIPTEDVVNNVRLSRCFYYVSDILRQIIDNGGITPTPVRQEKETKPRKRPFSLSPEQAERFEYSDAPITGSEIIRRIIAIASQDNMKKFPKRNLNKWLISLDLVEVITLNGSRILRPTPQGEEIGLLTEERYGSQGVYYVLLYSLDAQHFVIDNIEAVLTFENSRYREKMNLENQGKPWDEEQDKQLVELFNRGLTVGEIAFALKRTERGVEIRLRNKGMDPLR